MENKDTLRSIAGFLRARLDELGLDEVPDPRSNQGKRWPLSQVLAMVLLGLMAGCKGLAELEDLSGDTKGVIRRWLDIRGRLPDTSARSILCRLNPADLIPLLHRVVIAAQHRGAWGTAYDLPVKLTAMDGKGTSLPAWLGPYAQRHHPKEGLPYGIIRTITSTLTTSRSRGCIDVSPIPKETNEAGHFAHAFESLATNHASRFDMVSYDHGANSDDNARLVLAHNKQYLFQFNDERRRMQQLMAELLEHQPSVHTEVEINSRGEQVTRQLRMMRVNIGVLPGLPRKSEMWEHAKTILRVDKETEHTNNNVTLQRRYYVSSLPMTEMSAGQWNLAIKLHWGVETSHQILDVAFEEDKRPWIRTDPNGMLVMMILRRVAYTMLGLFRSVTQRSDEKREVAWRRLMKQVNNTLVGADEGTLARLRPRHRRRKRTRKPMLGCERISVRTAA